MPDDVEIYGYCFPNARPLHFHRHSFSCAQCPLVHLAKRCRRNRAR